MMIAVPVFLSFAARKTVTVGFVTLVIHFAFFVGASEGARTRSGPIVPSSPGTAPGQTGITGGSSAPRSGQTRRSPTKTQMVSRPKPLSALVGLRGEGGVRGVPVCTVFV